MGTSESGVLSVDKRIVLLAVLIAMSKCYLYVLAAHVHNLVKRIVGHAVGKEVGKTIA